MSSPANKESERLPRYRRGELDHHRMDAGDAIESTLAYPEQRKPEWRLSVKNDWPKWRKTPEVDSRFPDQDPWVT
jgi:hypothetical protein